MIGLDSKVNVIKSKVREGEVRGNSLDSRRLKRPGQNGVWTWGRKRTAINDMGDNWTKYGYWPYVRWNYGIMINFVV